MASTRCLPGQYRARGYNAEYSEFKEIREISEIDIRAILPKNIATLAPQPNFLSEVVRCGASQIKNPEDSTLMYSLGIFYLGCAADCGLSQEIKRESLT